MSSQSPGLLPSLLTRHTLSVGLQLGSRQASVGVVKWVAAPAAPAAPTAPTAVLTAPDTNSRSVLTSLVQAVEAGQADRGTVLKLLLEQDLAWDRTVVGGQVGPLTPSVIFLLHVLIFPYPLYHLLQVSELLTKAEGPVVRGVGQMLLTSLEGEGKVGERVASGGLLTRLVAHPAVQSDLAWRGRLLQGLASCSLLQGVQGVAPLTRQGQQGLRDSLARGLDSRNKSLEDSVTLTLGLVSWIRARLQEQGVKLIRKQEAQEEQEQEAAGAMVVIQELEERWGKEKSKEVGVFLQLYCHMWLQLFMQPELAKEVPTPAPALPTPTSYLLLLQPIPATPGAIRAETCVHPMEGGCQGG